MGCVQNSEQTSGRVRLFLHRFHKNQNGAIAPLFALMLPPILFSMMLAIDAANLMRVRGNVQHSLDASALAVGKRYTVVSTEDEIRAFGKKIFNANLRAITAPETEFDLTFPQSANVDQQIVASATFRYTSFFGKAVKAMTGGETDWDKYTYTMTATVRLKNTLEVALVLDNSGSMSYRGSGSYSQRITLLRSAAKGLVNDMATQAKLITHLEKPVQFSVVPFAASVNVGPENKDKLWMDQTGVSPVHYENFAMPTRDKSINVGRNKNIVFRNNGYFKEGVGWGTENGNYFTRFSLYNDIKNTRGRAFTSWEGCVEARPGIYGINADAPSIARPDSMYVPMFAPDEYDDRSSSNNWWPDNAGYNDGALTRQKDVQKYYIPYGTSTEDNSGPNYSCTTTPITTLTDVTTSDGLTTIENAIDRMRPNGATNVPEGMVWGWRTLIENSPFAGGRPSSERGNDKVVIVLTDGANTYYRYNNDYAGNLSRYAALGYAGVITEGYSKTRIFQETTGVSQTHSNSNYTNALNSRFLNLCKLAKDNKIMVMTVALDLEEGTPSRPTDGDRQMAVMKECASKSRVRFDKDNPTQRAKLFWNTKGSELAQTFKEIADELSNLRVVK